MAVAPFSSRYGEHYRYDKTVIVGIYSSWYTAEYTNRPASAWYVKPNANKGPRYTFIHGFKVFNIKDDFRVAATLNECRPRVHTDTYSDGAIVTYKTMIEGHINPRTPPVLNDTADEAMRTARTKALNKLKSNKSLQLANDMIEARKTVNMVANPMIKVLNAYRAVRRGDPRSAARALGFDNHRPSSTRVPLNMWLELKYGWLPMLGTIEDGVSVLKEGFGTPAAGMYAKVVGGDKRPYEWESPSSGNESLKLYGEIHARCGLIYTVDDAIIRSLDDAGVLNPLSIAWEAVPFSFVLDWFIPVGNVLSALSATAGLKFVHGWESSRHDKHEVLTTRKMDPHPDPSKKTTLIDPGMYHSESSYYFRTRIDKFPLPGLYTAPNPFSTERAISAVALLRQLF